MAVLAVLNNVASLFEAVFDKGAKMTYEERNSIFAKEYLSYKDIAKLFDIDEASASTLLQTIKSHSDRLHKKGKIHIQDYFNYFGITNFERYIDNNSRPTA